MRVSKNFLNTYANRGMDLENDINISNEHYRNIDKALIYKKPTPIKISKVNYPAKNKAIISEAFFEIPSTTDYNGIYKGKYIDFDAKEVKGKDSFVLSNLHKHQLEHLIKVLEHGGISFIIVRFYIPLSYFLENGYEIKDKYTPRVDYLEVLDKLYF